MSSGRFTEKDENGKWRLDVSPYYPPFYETLIVVDEDSFYDYIYGPAIDRLGEYEDLNFSPDTLKAIINEWKEWADAKNKGRLLILPCKVEELE